MNSTSIRAAFVAARQAGHRAKEAAHAAGVSEGAAVAAFGGDHAHALKAMPLRGTWFDILQALQTCGPVMALTRNATTVHEKVGVYQNLSSTGPMGLALGPDIDLRLFFNKWHAGFAISEPAANPGNPEVISLQFFDASGTAVHKVFGREATDRDAWRGLVAAFGDPRLDYVFRAAAPAPLPRPDAEVDSDGLAAAWAAMTDTHQFFMLLKKFAAERQQSFRLVEGRFTQRVPLSAVSTLLNQAAFEGVPLMVFVGNPGCIQIHSGAIQRVVPMDIKSKAPGAPDQRWLNILDPGFNLHLREDQIASVWVVEKPTDDGVVTSLEVFDTEGEVMAMFFGARKPGQPELQAWRDLVTGLPRVAAPESMAV